MNNRLLFVIVLLLVISSPLTTESDPLRQSLIVRNFSYQHGLPRDVVRDVIMTQDGAVWLAVWGGGVVIYKDSSHKNLSKENGLISNDVRSLAEDRQGRVWVGTAQGISCVFHQQIYNFSSKTVPEIPSNDSVFSIQEMPDGTVWFGDGLGFLYTWTPFSHSLSPLDGTWKIIHEFPGYPNATIRQITLSEDGRIFLAVDNTGIVSFRNSEDFDVYSWHKPNQITQYQYKSILLACNPPLGNCFDQIFSFCPEGNRFVSLFPSNINALAWAFETIFVGTETGLYTLENNTPKLFPLIPHEQQHFIESLRVLPDQSLWIGTRSGAFRIAKSPWIKVDHPSNEWSFWGPTLIFHESLGIVAMDDNKRLWHFSQNKWHKLVDFYLIGGNPKLFLPSPNSSQLLIHTDRETIQFDLEKKEVINVIKHDKDNLGLGISFVHSHTEWQIWFASLKGFLEWDGNQFIPTVDDPAIEKNDVLSALSTSPDEIWIGCRGHIDRWYKGKYQNVQIPPGFLEERNKVMSILKTQDGELWFSSLGEGILVFKDNQWNRITADEGLPSYYIRTLFQSRDGTIWAGDRTNGMMSYKDHVWIQYDSYDGFPSGEVVRIVEDREGNLWVGVTDRGIYRFIPDNQPPIARIVSSPQQLVPNIQGVFSYAGYDPWNHTPNESLLYSWRIADESTGHPVGDWSPYSQNTSTLIHPLPPGHYRFEVIAQDRDRNISPRPAQVSFKVNPYFWTTLSFQIPVFLSCFFAASFIYVTWNYYKQKKDIQMKREIVLAKTHEQQRIAQELHDSVIQDSISLSHHIDFVRKTLAKGKSNLDEQLQPVFSQLKQLHGNLRKIEKGLAPYSYGDVDLHLALRNIVYQIETYYRVPCETDIDSTICFEDRTKEFHICRIAHEALHNASKHAKASQLELRLVRENHHAILSILDDGEGFTSQDESKGRGLQDMKYTAQIIQAEFSIAPNEPRGTKVTCKIPFA